MDRYLITGCAGYLGVNIANYLLSNQNNIVHGIDDFSSSDFSNISLLLKNNNFIFNENSLNKNIDFTVDYIFHLCGCGDFKLLDKNPYEFIKKQFESLDIILKYTKLTGAKLFLFSEINTTNEIYKKYISLYQELVKSYSSKEKIDFKILNFDYAIGENFLKNDLRLVPNTIIASLNDLDVTLENNNTLSIITMKELMSTLEYLINNHCEDNMIFFDFKNHIKSAHLADKIIELISNNTKIYVENLPVFMENKEYISQEVVEALNNAILFAKTKYFI